MENKINDKNIVIFGSGGHGKVVLDILLCSNQKILGFLDDDLSKKETKVRGFRVLGDWEYLEKNKEIAVVLGVGNNETRYRLYNRIKTLGCDLVTAIHPKAIISQDVKIGQGVVIMPGAVINPGTVIEDGCVVNTGATVDHDCRLKKFSQVWPGAHLAGGVEVGEFSCIGIGASVIQNIKIGKNVIIGAGAAVVRNIQDNVVAMGVPAKVIKENNVFKENSMLLDIKYLLIEETCSIRQVMQVIDRNGWRMAFAINNKKLVGSITDGDIRRAILRGEDINIPVSMIMNKTPVFLFEKDLTNRQLVQEKIKELQTRVKDLSVILIVNSQLNPIMLRNISELTAVKSTDSHLFRSVRKILIVGGAGYLGSVLVGELIKSGYDVRVLDILMFGEEPIQKYFTSPKFELIRGDMRNISVLTKALENIDGVINLAALVGDPACKNNPSDTIETNYLANKILAEVCKYHQVNRFLFASTCSVYGQNDQIADENTAMNPVSLYARSKIQSEEGILGLKDENFAPTILRMATLYGHSPRMRFDLVVNTMTKDAITKKEISVHGGGTQWRPLLEVSDAANIFIKCLEAPIDLIKGQIFNAGSEEQNYQIRDIASEVHHLIPDAKLEIEESLIDNRNYVVSFAKVREKLGFLPRKDITQAILEIKQAIESNKITDVNHKKYYNIDYTTEFIVNNRL